MDQHYSVLTPAVVPLALTRVRAGLDIQTWPKPFLYPSDVLACVDRRVVVFHLVLLVSALETT